MAGRGSLWIDLDTSVKEYEAVDNMSEDCRTFAQIDIADIITADIIVVEELLLIYMEV